MEKTLICLANSKKYTNRCIAGIELLISHTGYKIVRQDNMPKWIRPVSLCEHGEVDTDLVAHIQLLDVIQFTIHDYCPDKAQTENVYFDENSFEVIGSINPNPTYLDKFCSNLSDLFGNDDPFVSEADTDWLDYSLDFIFVENFSYFETLTMHGGQQLRGLFTYWNVNYNLPITDLGFIQKANNGEIRSEVEMPAYLTISLGTLFKGNHYKLIAGIIPII